MKAQKGVICNINQGNFFLLKPGSLQTLTCILQGAMSPSYSYRLFRKNHFKKWPGKTGPDHSSLFEKLFFFSIARPKIHSFVFTAASALCPAQPAPIKLQFIMILRREREALGHHRLPGLRKEASLMSPAGICTQGQCVSETNICWSRKERHGERAS